MRRLLVIAVVLAQAFLMSACAAAWKNVSYSDDLYSVHNKIAIAERQKAEAELAKAQYEAQQAQYEAAIAKLNAEAAQYGYTVSTEGSVNGYDAVLADSYESAYARRLYGFSSPTYRMPSSYYTWRYSDAFFYASAYDPAFYNVVVSGDMVWVEPKYVTSMFGSWGATVVPSYSWYYGWNDPFYYWTNPYRYNYSWYYGWNNPYYWGWSCGYPYYHNHYYHSYHHHNYRPSYHRPPHHNKPPHDNRPPYAGSGSVGNTGHHQINRPGAVVGRNPGASTPADRVGNFGGIHSGSGVNRGDVSYTPSKQAAPSAPSKPTSPSTPAKPPKPSVGRATQPTYRVGGSSSNSTSKESKGSTSYRSGSSSSSSSNRGSSTPSYRSGSSSSSRSYSTPSSSSFNSSRSSGGYSGGGYSGGGNSRGR